MKKTIVGIITAALVLAMTVTSAFAAPHHAEALERIGCGFRAGGLCRGVGFVDTDGDGICDNYDPEYCPGNGMGPGNGNGNGFIDADGDGICDNYDPDYCPGIGMGYGHHGGMGYGHGMGNGCHGGRAR